jgi:hypothetical protein
VSGTPRVLAAQPRRRRCVVPPKSSSHALVASESTEFTNARLMITTRENSFRTKNDYCLQAGAMYCANGSTTVQEERCIAVDHSKAAGVVLRDNHYLQ